VISFVLFYTECDIFCDVLCEFSLIVPFLNVLIFLFFLQVYKPVSGRVVLSWSHIVCYFLLISDIIFSFVYDFSVI